MAMDETEKKGGYAYLIDWIIRIGDLCLINFFFLVVYLVFKDTDTFSHSLHYREKMIAFLLINLCYFIVSSFIQFHISFNIAYLEKIVQRSSYFIMSYALLLTAGSSVFNIVNIRVVPWLIGVFVLCTLFIGWHILFRILLKSYRRRGYNYRQVIIVGGGSNGIKVYEALIFSDFGYKVMGFFDDNPDKADNMPNYLGSTDGIQSYVKSRKIDEIFCTISANQEDLIYELVRFSEKNMIRFHLVPEFHKYIKRRFSLHFVESIPMLSLRYEPLQHFMNRFVKRSFDLVFSGLVLVTVFPAVYLICGFLIKRSSPGPILFRQKRTGIKGKEFYCYKFRSMRLNKEANSKQAVEGDPRVTTIGNFMRRTSIDEIPQFINVLKNDMSVVGPRPHMSQHTELYSSIIDKFMVRHLVKPGITGWAQVSGCRGETKTVDEMEERVKRDVWYLENWTFFLDLKIIYLTIYNAIKGEKKAY